MNDRAILLGIVIIIVDLFLIFAGTFNHLDQAYSYYLFDGIIVLGMVISLVGAFLSAPKREIVPVA